MLGCGCLKVDLREATIEVFLHEFKGGEGYGCPPTLRRSSGASGLARGGRGPTSRRCGDGADHAGRGA